MSRTRVLYLLTQYPQLSETYIQNEIEAVQSEFDVVVISLTPADYPQTTYTPYKLLAARDDIQAEIERFRPHVIHTHWLHKQLETVVTLARSNSIPFTVRSHSFDTLFAPPSVPRPLSDAIGDLNGDLCLGVLAMPFAVPNLTGAGLDPRKIKTVYPAVRYSAFLNRNVNGSAVMNVGASLPKKRFEDFVALAALLPGTAFDLYPIGYGAAALAQLNEAHGHPVTLHAPVEPHAMPPVYKAHRWLVVTASRTIGTVGWPLCVAEAQASGVGVCVPSLRADLKEYVGEAGFFYDSVDEARDIISRPYPDDKREAGFDQARKSDIALHKTALTDLWRAAAVAA